PTSDPSPCGLFTQPEVPLVKDASLPKGASTSWRNSPGDSQLLVCFSFSPPTLGSSCTSADWTESFTAASFMAPPTACCTLPSSCLPLASESGSALDTSALGS